MDRQVGTICTVECHAVGKVVNIIHENQIKQHRTIRMLYTNI